MRIAVVTGGSSGIGLEFVRHLLTAGGQVVAASRRAETSEQLLELKQEHGARLLPWALDVSDPASRATFAQRVFSALDRLDLLVNAAGIIGGDEESISVFGALDQEELARTFLVNGISPLMMTELLAPLLENGDRPIVANISSLNGSIARWDRPGKYSYCASKAALNMISKTLSVELREGGIRVVALHPGWVRTWMTRHEPAPMEASESVAGMLRVIDALRLDESGRFLDWRGREVPW
jgi:NAD(P)-dependent dehydrogenase (short-subunit alcohol dehydrogenase family)